jgi:hypothetical protein
MNNKPLIELKEGINPYGKPYLFILRKEEFKVQIISSYDREFYKEFMKLKEDYCNDVIECSKKTKKLLEKDISYLLDNYRFDEEILKEGKDLYRYEQFMKIEKDTKFIRENTLYDWSLFKENCNYRKNYIDTINYLNDEGNKLFYSILIHDCDGIKICVNDRLKPEYKVYFEVNCFVTSLFLKKINKILNYVVIKQGKEKVVAEEKCITERVKDFKSKIRKISSNLLLPYDEIIRLTEKINTNDIYELLDYIGNEIHDYYPREEIKEHLLNCIFVKGYEEKHKEGVKTYEKNIFQRFRNLF